MDREERKVSKGNDDLCPRYWRIIDEDNSEAIDVVDGLGQSHHESLRNIKMGIVGKRFRYDDPYP